MAGETKFDCAFFFDERADEKQRDRDANRDPDDMLFQKPRP